ncbi:cytochrome C oxidase subunit IV family protein [Novosphingobium lentum]|uniref:cytochrome C oxidase subunit IV family protein n=1 Tax=Novosphingobium lentum TaxID=145287 RepID=UPI000833DD9E|nr:cytochrome C oxidase subunit IV family protein [Novosphingobium lentum]
MSGRWLPRLSTVWLILVGMTIGSTLLAEESAHARFAIAAIFLIAAIKSELVLTNYMEAGRAEPQWRWLYRLWITAITVLMIGWHLA